MFTFEQLLRGQSTLDIVLLAIITALICIQKSICKKF